jgi:hypothetical protein
MHGTVRCVGRVTIRPFSKGNQHRWTAFGDGEASPISRNFQAQLHEVETPWHCPLALLTGRPRAHRKGLQAPCAGQVLDLSGAFD